MCTSTKLRLQKLAQKLVEAKSKKDLLIPRHRRSQVAARAGRAEMGMGSAAQVGAFGRLSDKVHHAEAVANTQKELADENVEEQFAQMEKNEEIERLLADIKGRRTLNAYGAALSVRRLRCGRFQDQRRSRSKSYSPRNTCAKLRNFTR